MQISIAGHAVHAATGGRAHQPGRPLAVFVHGAGLDHTVWAFQSRWLAFRGWNVLAVDLPGHGLSDGPPLADIGAMADWLAALIGTAATAPAALIGHSMGALIALDTAARFPDRVRSIALLGAALAMPVHPELLSASAANSHSAIDMVNLWGYGYAAGLGGSRAPGVWMVGVGERILEKAKPGILHTDLAACDAYKNAALAAASVKAPSLVVCGARDQMTPHKNGRALAALLGGTTLIVLEGAGHMLMAERPYEVQQALAAHLSLD
jgi:pimeloyl-ACP methyl ester carboxylesterase